MPTKCKISDTVLILGLFGVCLFMGIFQVYGYTAWQTYRDDDGTLGSLWGSCGSHAYILRKTFVVDKLEGA